MCGLPVDQETRHNPGRQFLTFDFDSCVIHISEPVDGRCFSEGAHLLHEAVGHDGKHWRTHCTAVFPSV